jgi:superfamily II DNA or RNA helicase
MEKYAWQLEALVRFLKVKSLLCDVNVGAGKTYFAISCVEELLKRSRDDFSVLVVTPTIVLMKKNWYVEFINNGFSKEDLGMYYGISKELKKITLTTVASFPNVSKLKRFDFLIYDEVHHCTSGVQLDSLFKTYEYILGLSSTISCGSGMNVFLKSWFKEVYTFSSSEALSLSLMNRFTLKNIGIKILDVGLRYSYDCVSSDITKILDKGGGFNKIMKGGFSKLKSEFLVKSNIRKGLVNGYLRKVIVCANLICKNLDKQIIVFSETIKSVEYLKKELDSRGVSCGLCSSKTKVKDRDLILDRYSSGELKVLLTARMFDEGYNLPKIDMAIVYSGNSKYSQLKQRIGRATRKKSGDIVSKIYQLYLCDTYEERYVKTRTKDFKHLCDSFEEIIV